jgi:ATP phosphoribosyltransferase regulatory subunit
MEDFKPLIPQGVQCYYGEEVARRRAVESVLTNTIKSWGFDEIILPFFDFLDDFTHGLGSQLGDKAYRFLDTDGSILALRPDFTTMVAKAVATRMVGEPPPIKLQYSGAVFRKERARAGRHKELYQVGLETMGVARIWADIEVILLAIECLQRLGLQSFKIVLGHAGFFNGIVAGLDLDLEKIEDLRGAIDHKDPAWLEKEVEDLPISTAKKRFLVDLPFYSGDRKVLSKALSVVRNQRSRKALTELSEISDVIEALDLEKLLTFDLAEVRGLDYYTGIVFKIYGDSIGFELGGGGRYDGLLAKFGWDIPAVGWEFTLDSLLPLVGSLDTLQVPSEVGSECVAADGRSLKEIFQQVWALRGKGAGVLLREEPKC